MDKFEHISRSQDFFDYSTETWIDNGCLFQSPYTEKNFRRLICPKNPYIIEKSVYLRNQPWYKPVSR